METKLNRIHWSNQNQDVVSAVGKTRPTLHVGLDWGQ